MKNFLDIFKASKATLKPSNEFLTDLMLVYPRYI